MYSRVESQIWTDEKLITDPDARYLLLYLLTNQHRNNLGLYHLPFSYAIHDTGLSPKRFSKAFGKLLAEKMISFDESTNFCLVHNFIRYNPLDNHNQVKFAISKLSEIPNTILLEELSSVLDSLGSTVLEPLRKRLRERLAELLRERFPERYGKQVQVKVTVPVEVEGLLLPNTACVLDTEAQNNNSSFPDPVMAEAELQTFGPDTESPTTAMSNEFFILAQKMVNPSDHAIMKRLAKLPGYTPELAVATMQEVKRRAGPNVNITTMRYFEKAIEAAVKESAPIENSMFLDRGRPESVENSMELDDRRRKRRN